MQDAASLKEGSPKLTEERKGLREGSLKHAPEKGVTRSDRGEASV